MKKFVGPLIVIALGLFLIGLSILNEDIPAVPTPVPPTPTPETTSIVDQLRGKDARERATLRAQYISQFDHIGKYWNEDYNLTVDI